MANWSASTEREMRKYETWVVDLLDRIERLRRQRNRPKVGLLAGTEQPELEVGEYMDWKTVVCAICARDHRAGVGPELMVRDSEDAVVCWACGGEVVPNLAARVFARRSEYAEQEALNFLSIAADWLSDHVTTVGKGEREDYFEERCKALRDELRQMKEEGFEDPEAWVR